MTVTTLLFAALCGVIAAVLIQFLFAPALVLMLSLNIPSGIYLGAFLLMLLVYWSTFRCARAAYLLATHLQCRNTQSHWTICIIQPCIYGICERQIPSSTYLSHYFINFIYIKKQIKTMIKAIYSSIVEFNMHKYFTFRPFLVRIRTSYLIYLLINSPKPNIFSTNIFSTLFRQ